MSDFKTTKRTGIVTFFEDRYGKGEVRCGNEHHEFFSYWFRSERPFRFPRIGECVDIIFNDKDELVSVRSVKS